MMNLHWCSCHYTECMNMIQGKYSFHSPSAITQCRLLCAKCMGTHWLVFLQWTVSLDWHVTASINFIFSDLIDAERQYRYLQQDAAICEACETRMGNKWFCISILNDLLLLQFYLFGNLKGKVYQNYIHTSLALQNANNTCSYFGYWV
jgi:hypothetical protein